MYLTLWYWNLNEKILSPLVENFIEKKREWREEKIRNIVIDDKLLSLNGVHGQFDFPQCVYIMSKISLMPTKTSWEIYFFFEGKWRGRTKKKRSENGFFPQYICLFSRAFCFAFVDPFEGWRNNGSSTMMMIMMILENFVSYI